MRWIICLLFYPLFISYSLRIISFPFLLFFILQHNRTEIYTRDETSITSRSKPRLPWNFSKNIYRNKSIPWKPLQTRSDKSNKERRGIKESSVRKGFGFKLGTNLSTVGISVAVPRTRNFPPLSPHVKKNSDHDDPSQACPINRLDVEQERKKKKKEETKIYIICLLGDDEMSNDIVLDVVT